MLSMAQEVLRSICLPQRPEEGIHRPCLGKVGRQGR